MLGRRAKWCVAGFGLALGLAGPGCLFRTPDPRNFSVTDLPPIPADARTSAVVQTSGAPPKEPAKQPTPAAKKDPQLRPLTIPPELPGADAPPIAMLPVEGGGKDRFPTLAPLGAETVPAPSPTGQPLTLAELEQIALKNNPTVRQAAANVEAQRGQAIQAGLYPNPVVGFQADQIGTGNGITRRGQPGGFFQFVWKTAGKLRLAELVQMMDYYNAQVALRRAEIDLVNQVRANYFAVLVAKEAVSVDRALARFTEDLYKAQQGLVRGAEQAPYEPLQSYGLALQARAALVQARNRYASAWRQLAASLGQPALPPTEIAGRADAPPPTFDLAQLRESVLANHTDVLTAQNSILQARYQLRLAEVTPIPDITTQVYVEHDWTTPPFRAQFGIQSGGPIPIFDRNQGGRLAAKAQLARAIQDVPRVQNDLSARLAQAFENYENARVLVKYYRDELIPTQVRVYRAVYQRYQIDPGKLSYNDVVTAQQTLANYLATYLTSLASLWQAVVDVATLAQTEELYLPAPPPGVGSLDQVLCPPTWSPSPASAPAAPPAPAPTTAPEPKWLPVVPK